MATFTFSFDPIAKEVLQRIAHDATRKKNLPYEDPPIIAINDSVITFVVTSRLLYVVEGYYSADKKELFNILTPNPIIIDILVPGVQAPSVRQILEYLLAKSVAILPQDRGLFHSSPGKWLVTGNIVEPRLIGWARLHSPTYKKIVAHFEKLTPYSLKYNPSPWSYLRRLTPHEHSTPEENDLLQQLKQFALTSKNANGYTLLGQILGNTSIQPELSILLVITE